MPVFADWCGRRITHRLVCNVGPVAMELYEALTGVQQEMVQDKFGWVVPVT